MSSLQPISSAAMSSLIQEIDAGAAALFGDPFASGTTPGTATGPMGKLARVMNMLRRKVVPLVWRSINMSQVTVVWRSVIVDDPENDPLGSRFATTEVSVDAVAAGASVENIERGLLTTSDYEVLIPANALTTPLTANDAMIIDGVIHDIVGITAHPKTPAPVAYRYLMRRAA